MAFESLTERLQGVFKNIRGKRKLSEKDVQEVTKEIRLALLEADVALPVVKTFIKRVRERAIGHEIIDTLDPTQQIVKIVNEELTEILGSETAERCEGETNPAIDTYEDHRMAMAFAPAALKLKNIRINNPQVVSKSYPGFWNDLKKAGFIISEE